MNDVISDQVTINETETTVTSLINFIVFTKLGRYDHVIMTNLINLIKHKFVVQISINVIFVILTNNPREIIGT